MPPIKRMRMRMGMQTNNEEFQAQIDALLAILKKLNTAQEGGNTFSRNLTIGSTGHYVTALQQFLKDNGHLDKDPDGYFGFQTQTAVEAYQRAAGTEVSGYFGPLTRGHINAALLAADAAGAAGLLGSLVVDLVARGDAAGLLGSQAVVDLVAAADLGAIATSFDRNLRLGDTASDVYLLQQFLINNGYLEQSQLRGEQLSLDFDIVTKAAVRSYQEVKDNNLIAHGYFGPSTRAHINNARLGTSDTTALSAADVAAETAAAILESFVTAAKVVATVKNANGSTEYVPFKLVYTSLVKNILKKILSGKKYDTMKNIVKSFLTIYNNDVDSDTIINTINNMNEFIVNRIITKFKLIKTDPLNLLIEYEDKLREDVYRQTVLEYLPIQQYNGLDASDKLNKYFASTSNSACGNLLVGGMQVSGGRWAVAKQVAAAKKMSAAATAATDAADAAKVGTGSFAEYVSLYSGGYKSSAPPWTPRSTAVQIQPMTDSIAGSSIQTRAMTGTVQGIVSNRMR